MLTKTVCIIYFKHLIVFEFFWWTVAEVYYYDNEQQVEPGNPNNQL